MRNFLVEDPFLVSNHGPRLQLLLGVLSGTLHDEAFLLSEQRLEIVNVGRVESVLRHGGQGR